MPSKRPALRALPTPDQGRGKQLQRQVSAIVRRHVEDACERAWAEVAYRFGTPPLCAKADASTSSAQQATRALATLLTNGLSRLAIAALVLPSRGQGPRRRRWPASSLRLAAIPGGLRRNGHAADGWRPGEPPSSR
jgi:hypothetical protein